MTKSMILAAGRGTRLQDLTNYTPKPLVAVAGVQPLIRTLGLLAQAEYKKTVVNAWYLSEKIEQAVAPVRTPEVIVSKETQLLGSGGGVRYALPHLGKNPFLVVNGDAVWSEETHPILAQLPKHFDLGKMDGLLLMVPTEKTQGHQGLGDFFLEDSGQLRWRGAAEKAPYVYTGIQVLHPRVFERTAQDVFSLLDIYKKAVCAGRLYGHVYAGDWVDMGTPDGLQAAASLLRHLGVTQVA